jgi:hypothetical protein
MEDLIMTRDARVAKEKKRLQKSKSVVIIFFQARGLRISFTPE